MGEYAPARPAPIAVVGIGCRVPRADGPADFWKLLMDEVCAVGEAPPVRFGRPYGIPGAGVRTALLDGVDRFDAEFFGISPREAEGMDPQTRLFLETAWEALEDAGQDTSKLAGTRTGVFVGTTNVHYWDLQQSIGHPDIHASLGAGSRSTTTGRLSFALDVTGPGLSVDTACSSSLTAVALACQSLQTGESETAIAGGAQLLLTNSENHGFVEAGVFADNCRFGAADADGFVFSEGVGAVVLKPLDRALADGDPIRAVIRGWSTNNDGAGASTMITPALSGQQQMLRQAYAHAGIAPADVDYVEGHGTGTRAGDPVELGAIATVLGGARPDGPPLLVGSVKSNIGHTGAAAGVLGLIKVVLSLQHRTVPRSLHVTERTGEIDWDAAGMDIPGAAVPVRAQGRPLTAGVSAFGVSGTNVHVVLTGTEQPVDATRRSTASAGESAGAQLLLLSGASPEALRQRARDLADHLVSDGSDTSGGPDSSDGSARAVELADICHTAAVRRAHHDYRLSVVGDSREALAAELGAALAEGVDAQYAGRPRVAFVFSGHGSQWIGMGRELMDASPAFSAALIRCDEAVRAETGWSVIERLTDGSDLIDETVAVVHPVLWAVQVALAETWRAWGVEPDVVIGHSMGESAASAVAGALSLADAAAVVCRRSRLIRDRVAGRGTMSVAALPAADAEKLIAELAVEVSVAASNGPRTTVLAGAVEGIEKIKAELDARDVFCRVMKAEAASHCSQMDPVLGELAEALREVRPRQGRVPMRSTVTGEPVDGTGLDAAYWTRNLRGRVHFHEAVLATAEEAPTVFVEMSPHPILTGAVRDCLADAGLPGGAFGSLVREEPERETLLAHLGKVYETGAPVDWERLYGTGRNVPLPAYPWQRESYWLEDLDLLPVVRDFVLGPASPLLADAAHGRPVTAHGPEFLEAVRAVAVEAAGGGAVVLTGVDIGDAVLVNPGDEPVVRVTLTPEVPGERWRFEVTSRPAADAGDWRPRCKGTVAVADEGPAPVALAEVLGRCSERWDAETFYRRVPRGDRLSRVVDELWLGQGEAVARLSRPASLEPDPGHPVHPQLVHAAYQPVLALLPDTSGLVPRLERFTVTGRATQTLWSTCRISRSADGGLVVDVALLDDRQRVVAEAAGMPIRDQRDPDGTEAAGHADAQTDAQTAETGENHVHTTTAAESADAPASAARKGADTGIELTGELRLTDPGTGFSIELRGSLRISRDAVAAPAAVPAPVPAPVPRTLPAPVSAPVVAAPVVAAPPTPSAPTPPAPTPTASVPSVPAAPDDRPTVERVGEHVAAILKMRVARLDVNKPLSRLGMDSLMGTQLLKRLERELGVTLPPTTLTRGVTTAALAREIEARTGA